MLTDMLPAISFGESVWASALSILPGFELTFAHYEDCISDAGRKKQLFKLSI